MPILPRTAPDVPAYALLASAIVGHRVGVYFRTGQSAAACSDGRDIFLIPPNANEGRWDSIAVQAMLIAEDSLDPSILLNLIGRPRAAQRYLLLEAGRAARALEWRVPGSFVRAVLAVQPDFVSSSPAESCEWALHRKETRSPPPWFGAVLPMMVARRTLQAKWAGAKGGTIAASPACGVADEDVAAEDSKLLKLLSSPFGGGLFADLLGRLMGLVRQAGAQSDKSGAGVVAEGRVSARLGAPGDAQWSSSVSVAAHLTADGSALRYPEWDLRLGRHRENWVSVEEFSPWSEDEPTDLTAIARPPARELLLRLAPLGLALRRRKHESQGEDLEIDNAVKLRADISAVGTGDERVFTALRRKGRDLSVLLLVDNSSSVTDAAADGESIHWKHLRAAHQLAGAFYWLGAEVALYGFHSWGRERVHCLRVLAFGEQISKRVEDRMAQLAPAGFTRIGAAVRHATRRLREQASASNRLILLITDGFSYDTGYEGAYGEADTRSALSEAAVRGVGCVCLCVGSDTEQGKLKRIFGASSLLQLAQADEMARHLPRACNEALRQAQAAAGRHAPLHRLR